MIEKKYMLYILPIIFGIMISPLSAQNQSRDENRNLLIKSLEELLNTEIIVASKRSESAQDAPGIITVITRDEIDGFAAANLGEILNRIPGAMLLSPNIFVENVLSIRGQSLTPYDNHTLLLINGRPLRDPNTGGGNNVIYNAFPLHLIERIEVIRGPGSVLYGSCAFSGVINIVTSSTEDEGVYGHVGLKRGSWSTAVEDLGLGIQKGDFSALAGFSYFKNDGPTYEFTDYPGVRSSAAWDRKSFGFFTNMEYKGFRLEAVFADLLMYSLDGKNNNWNHENAHDNNRRKAWFLDAGYYFSPGQYLDLNFNITYNRNSWDQSEGANMTSSDILFETSANYEPLENLRIIAGGSIEQAKYAGERFIDDKTNSTALYLQVDYKPVENLKIIGGLQWNKIEGITGNLSPRLGLIYNFNPGTGIKLLHSTAYRKAYPLETSFNHPVFRGNKEIKPELIATSEVQLFFKRETFHLSLTGFYSKMSEIIIRKWVPDSSIVPYGGYLKYFNGGTHTFRGLELEGKGFVLEELFATFSITYQENEDGNGLKDAALHPNFMVKFGLQYQDPVVSVGVYNSFFGAPTPVSHVNPSVKELNKKAEAFSLLSLKITVNLLKLFGLNKNGELILSLEGENLLGKDIRYPDYPTKGLNTLLPLRGGTSFLSGITFKF